MFSTLMHCSRAAGRAAGRTAPRISASLIGAQRHASSNSGTATITYNGKTVDLPVLSGTMGPSVLDVRKLYSQLGMFTHDPGFTSTSSCLSDITFIDGDKGVLMHRGYPIEQLARYSDYLEVCYLILHGELPNKTQKEDFVRIITHHTMIHEKMRTFLEGFPGKAHPMSVLLGMVGSMSAFYHEDMDIDSEHSRDVTAHRLIAKMPTLAAWSYKHSIGQPLIYPQNGLSYSENFLRMMFSTPCAEYKVNSVLARAIDLVLILHADHEQNASTSTVRIAGSSKANPFACITAGIASLWGGAHGGANEAVLNMLRDIGHKDNIPSFIDRAKSKHSSNRLMGFGHRVYKNYDPRAVIMRQTCHQVLNELGIKNPLLEIAMELEKIALSDPYFIEKKLYPNVDFYSGIVLSAIGIPTNMFTVIFAMARTSGWISHWIESLESPDFKISRPRQLYTGPAKRDFLPLEKR
mmetsp:Transcript_53036/g.133359  ORF Transcript_53036/g.133359 Transcript_53036/m.133359 type:complete len:464 (+) Transcript_53036:26-1417(+)